MAKALKVTNINVHVKGNSAHHRTNKYECTREDQPVMRRGDLMKVTLTFDREYDIDKYDAKLEFSTGIV